MEFLWDLFHQIYDVESLVRVGGLLALTAIVFAETGLLIGFFLPGDSLLVTAGLFAATGDLNMWSLNIVLSLAAIIGDTVGYGIGAKTGPKIFTRENSLFFNRKHLLTAKEFYEKHGGFTIVIARFIPIIRTFAPVVAGVGAMQYRKFVSYNVFGGIGWVHHRDCPLHPHHPNLCSCGGGSGGNAVQEVCFLQCVWRDRLGSGYDFGRPFFRPPGAK